MSMRGVNLGGWLLLEKWITPSLFTGLSAEDEYTFCLEDARNGYKRLREHRANFITRDDFAWLAQHGVNTVRLPVGYWALDDDNPYLNCRQQLDNAFQWAGELGLDILLDLHGAPGSQNGRDHSGKTGPTKWTRSSNRKRTLEVLEQLALRYGTEPALWGISLLNEPGWKVSLWTLRRFYGKGYDVVRKHCDERVAIVISDAFRPRKWNGFMTGPRHTNVVLDMHLYQAFGRRDKTLDPAGHIAKTRNEWSGLIARSDKPVIIGEWSLGLDPKTFAGMDEKQKHAALRSYADAQIDVFNHSAASFFWTYKTEDASDWNLRHLMEQGSIADSFQTGHYAGLKTFHGSSSGP